MKDLYPNQRKIAVKVVSGLPVARFVGNAEEGGLAGWQRGTVEGAGGAFVFAGLLKVAAAPTGSEAGRLLPVDFK